MAGNWIAKTLGKVGTRADEGPVDVDVDEDLLVLVQGKNVFNDKIYCYLKIPSLRLEEFNKILRASNNFDLRQFGTVVAAGRGIPSSDVQTEVIQELGLKPDKPQ